MRTAIGEALYVHRRAGLYLRISRDRDGTGLAIERQRELAQALLRQRSWRFAGEWIDAAITASGRRARPGFTAMVAAVTTGQIDVIVAWDLSRLARNARDRLALVEACREHGVIIALVQGSDMDPTTAAGRLYIGLMGEVAEHELGIITERIQAEKRQAAHSGRYRGGPRPYGYERDGRTVVPAEASFVADATHRVLAGESIVSIVRWANDQGLTTSTGKPWSPVTLRRVLLRARNAGLVEREHRGNGRTEPEILAEADWPGIVSQAQWRQLTRVLGDRTRRTSPSNDHRWLLAGLARCGRCGASIKSGSGRGAGGYVPTYRCSASAHLTRLAQPLDDYVTDLVIMRMAAPDAAAAIAEPADDVDLDELNAERAELVEGQGRLSRALARGRMKEAVHDAEYDQLQAEIDRIDEVLGAAVATHPASALVDTKYMDVIWAGMSTGQQKAIVRRLLKVTVLPGRRGAKGFDPNLVDVEWL